MLARTLEAASKRALANPYFSDLRTELLLSARDVRVRRPEIAERVYRKSGCRVRSPMDVTVSRGSTYVSHLITERLGF